MRQPTVRAGDITRSCRGVVLVGLERQASRRTVTVNFKRDANRQSRTRQSFSWRVAHVVLVGLGFCFHFCNKRRPNAQATIQWLLTTGSGSGTRVPVTPVSRARVHYTKTTRPSHHSYFRAYRSTPRAYHLPNDRIRTPDCFQIHLMHMLMHSDLFPGPCLHRARTHTAAPPAQGGR